MKVNPLRILRKKFLGKASWTTKWLLISWTRKLTPEFTWNLSYLERSKRQRTPEAQFGNEDRECNSGLWEQLTELEKHKFSFRSCSHILAKRLLISARCKGEQLLKDSIMDAVSLSFQVLYTSQKQLFLHQDLALLENLWVQLKYLLQFPGCSNHLRNGRTGYIMIFFVFIISRRLITSAAAFSMTLYGLSSSIFSMQQKRTTPSSIESRSNLTVSAIFIFLLVRYPT